MQLHLGVTLSARPTFIALFTVFLTFIAITVSAYTDKKENKTCLIYKEIQMGSGAKSYNEEGLPNI
jgi:hypothetical protein